MTDKLTISAVTRKSALIEVTSACLWFMSLFHLYPTRACLFIHFLDC